MPARRLRLESGEFLAAAATASITLLIALLAAHRAGVAGLLAPLALVVVAILMRRPAVMVGLTVVLATICEGPTFGFLHFTSHLYDQIYKGLTPLDMLVALAVLSVGIDLIARRRPLQVPRALAPAWMLLLLGMIAGVVTGHSAGVSWRSAILSENVLAYLLLLPLAVCNLKLDRRQVGLALTVAVALAILKGGFGIVEVLGHYGQSIEGTSTLTYYEPAANWLIMVALLAICAAVSDACRATRLDAGWSPPVDRFASALLSTLVLDRDRGGHPAGAAAGHESRRSSHVASVGSRDRLGDIAAWLDPFSSSGADRQARGIAQSSQSLDER